MGDFIGAVSTALPDKRVLMRRPRQDELAGVVSASTNVDSGNTPTTILPPGTILLGDATRTTFYDDASGGVVSTQAQVISSEAVDGDWAEETITLTIDGNAIVTVTLGASDDTAAEIVAALNANAAFRAHAICAVSDTTKVSITLIEAGPKTLLVTSSLATAFGAAGQTDRGEDADWVVLTNHCNQLGPTGVAAAARANGVRSGEFDLSALRWASSGTPHADFFRVMTKRGARFF